MRKLVLLLAFATWLAFLSPHGLPAAQPPDEVLLLDAAANLYGLDPSGLSVVSSATATYPLSARQIRVGKVYDARTDRVVGIALDETGRVVNPEEAETTEAALWQAKYGKLSPRLHELLGATDDGAQVQIAIRINAQVDAIWTPSPEEHAALGPDAVQERLARESEAKRSEIAELERPLVEFLTSTGAKVLNADELVPWVLAEVPLGGVSEVAERSDVALVDRVDDNSPALSTSAKTVHTHYAWNSGYSGAGVKVAVIEWSRIRTDNNYLQGSIVNRRNQCVEPGHEEHSTNVAGVVGSDHTSDKGVAYNASLVGGESCGWADGDLQLATLWSIIQGSQVLNNSWGADTGGAANTMSRYQDDLIHTWRLTVVDAAGNHSQCPAPGRKVLAPALAYNVIAVGNFSDANTWSVPSGWNDDSMASNTCYGDPSSLHGDRYKPDVAAPGVQIRTTSGSGNGMATVSGTSFSAPHVAAVAALMINKNGSLATMPEVVKAIIMASAIHKPISGDSVELSPAFYEMSGAGGVDAERALFLVGQSTWSGQQMLQSSFGSDGCKNYNYYTTAQQKVRVALAWAARGDYANYQFQPGTDLDLYVYGPSGNLVAASGTMDNTDEVLEFTAPQSGTYRVCVRKWRMDDYSTFMGVAWLTPASSICGSQC